MYACTYYMHSYLYVHSYTLTPTHLYAYAHINLYTPNYTHVHTHLHLYIHIYLYTPNYTHTYTPLYIYTYSPIHTHTYSYRADCLLFTSLNEVTPMVISEAMSHQLPILSTNIAGIPEMVTHGVEGFLFTPHDDSAALHAMHTVIHNQELRKRMGQNGLSKFKTRFDLELMVESYRELLLSVAPPLILVDMDGVIVDWDAGFYEAWGERCEVDREKSYFMVCVLSGYVCV